MPVSALDWDGRRGGTVVAAVDSSGRCSRATAHAGRQFITSSSVSVDCCRVLAASLVLVHTAALRAQLTAARGPLDAQPRLVHLLFFLCRTPLPHATRPLSSHLATSLDRSVHRVTTRSAVAGGQGNSGLRLHACAVRRCAPLIRLRRLCRTRALFIPSALVAQSHRIAR